jgi:tRNA nucleotidyltransferase (CCA-adding enzyme)
MVLLALAVENHASADAIHAALARLAVRGPVASRIEHALRDVGPLMLRLSDPAPLAPSALVALLEPAPVEAWALLRCLAPGPLEAGRIDAFLIEHRPVRAPLNGNDLRALGLSPGPRFREVLSELRRRALDGPLTREEAVAMVLAVVPPDEGGVSGS